MAKALTNVEFDIDCGISDEDLQQRLINAARDQADAQGFRCLMRRNPNSQTMHVIVRGEDQGKVLAYEAALKSWVLKIRRGNVN